MKKSKKLSDYEQVKCSQCRLLGITTILRAYLDDTNADYPIYQTSNCPKHGQFWMCPEVVKAVRLKNRDRITFKKGLQ